MPKSGISLPVSIRRATTEGVRPGQIVRNKPTSVAENRQGEFMARNGNAYAKRQRDLQKKQKAEDKRARRLKRKDNAKSSEGSSDGDRIPSEP